MNRIFILIPCVFFFLFNSAYADDIYIYQHQNRNIVITNTPIPEEYKTKAQKIGSFNSATNTATPAEQRQREKVHEIKSKKEYDPKEVEKEKKQLEAEIKRFKNLGSADSNTAQYYKYFIDNYENHLKLLEKDPESYFSKQEQFTKEVQKLLR